jgi:alanine dehydrogenase
VNRLNHPLIQLYHQHSGESTIETFILTRSDIATLLTVPDCIAAVAEAFDALGNGAAQPPVTAAVHAVDGGFHIKAGVLNNYFASKTNGNFPHNREVRGLPTIQGLLMLSDATDGRVLAVMDSIEITALRTAAATAVAARYLARPDSQTAVICGCGVQGRMQLRALMEVLPLRKAIAYDTDAVRAALFAVEMSRALKLDVIVAEELESALSRADVCVTCTTSEEFILHGALVRSGTFVAGVGVDNERKRELAPDLLAAAKVVTDLRAQCAVIGDLHHAIAAGVLTAEGVHADLADVVAGKRPGRETAQEIVVFDSTGVALQDVAAAIAVYKNAAALRHGGALRRIEFA